MNEKNIKNRERAFKGYASTYNIEILDSFKPELRLKGGVSAFKSRLIESLTQLRGFKVLATLVLVFKKIETSDETKYDNLYSAQNLIKESDVENVLKSVYTVIIAYIQKSLGKGSGWIIDSVIDHPYSISKYNPLSGSSFIM